MLGIALHVGGKIFHRRCGLLQRAGLRFGTGRQVVVANRDFARRGVDVVGALAHVAHHRRQALADTVQCLHQHADLVAPADVDLGRQIALGQFLSGVHRMPQRLRDHSLQHQVQHARRGQHGNQGEAGVTRLQLPHLLRQLLYRRRMQGNRQRRHGRTERPDEQAEHRGHHAEGQQADLGADAERAPIADVDADIQHGDHVALGILDRIVLRHVLLSEQLGEADIGLSGQQRFVAGMGAVEQGTDGAFAVFFLDRGRDADEVVAALDEDRGAHAGGCRKLVGYREIEVQDRTTVGEHRRGFVADHDLLMRIEGKRIRKLAGQVFCMLADLVAEWHQGFHVGFSLLFWKMSMARDAKTAIDPLVAPARANGEKRQRPTEVRHLMYSNINGGGKSIATWRQGFTRLEKPWNLT